MLRSGAELLVRVNLGRQRKVKVWAPGLRSLMLRSIPMQADFQQRVRFRRKFRLTSQGGKRARKRRKVETRVSIGPIELQPPEARWSILQGAQERRAHPVPPPSHGRSAVQVSGVRRRHELAGLLAGALRARCAAHAGGRSVDLGLAK